MNYRASFKDLMDYKDCETVPVVHFGYWDDTLKKWAEEGHIPDELADKAADGNQYDMKLDAIMGWDYNYHRVVRAGAGIRPVFERKVIETMGDGSRKVLNNNGVIRLEKPGASGIPMEFDYTLKDRASWDKDFKHRLQYSDDRISEEQLLRLKEEDSERTIPLGIHCGSLIGNIRNWVGMENLSFLSVDDPALFREMIDTNAELCYQCLKKSLEIYSGFDFGHFWEDICFKNGPLVIPSMFDELTGHHYRRITDLLREYDITIVSLDCDGLIDSLIPTWINNGVNTMFPIEVGTWGANIAPWRETYGRELRGVGGMNKTLFAKDKAAIDTEVERLAELVRLGGFIPCPDHRIAPDAEYELVKYYITSLREALTC